MTLSESKMWKYSTVILALVLLLASGLFLLLSAGPPAGQAGRLVVPLDQADLDPGTELTALSQERDQLRSDLDGARAEAADLKSAAAQKDANLAESDAKIAALSLERTNLMTQITDLIAARQAVERRLDEVQQEKNQVTALLEQARGERDTIDAALSQAAADRDRFAGEIKELRAQVAKLSIESGELDDLAGAESEALTSTDGPPDSLAARAEAGGNESSGTGPVEAEPGGTEAQQGADGGRPAKEWAFPLESDWRFADPAQEVGSVASDELASSPISGVLAKGVDQYNLGEYKVAFDIWYPLAEQGVRRAQFYVGSLFHEGRGVAEDPIKAFYWLSLSDKAGYAKAGQVLETVESVMTQAQIEAANKLLGTAEN